VTLRPCVQRFAELMETKLRENDGKGGWQDESTAYLSRRCGNELQELRELLTKRHRQIMAGYPPVRAETLPDIVVAIGREAADVANFAMMMADVCGALG
jgi:hypothetical protein